MGGGGFSQMERPERRDLFEPRGRLVEKCQKKRSSLIIRASEKSWTEPVGLKKNGWAGLTN